MHTVHKYAAAVLTAAALALVAAPAQADHVQPNLGIEVTSADPATRTVVGIQHCTSPEQAGRSATFTVTPDIEFNQFRPGAVWGIAVENGVILSTGRPPCNIPVGPRPGGPHMPPPGGPGMPPPGGPGMPPPGGPGMPPHGGPGGDPQDTGFSAGFLNRVWKFDVDVDSATATRMNVTIAKVLNLPKRFAGEDDMIVDQDAAVLVSGTAKIFRDGKRVSASAMDDADAAKVQGKLLPMKKWVTDEDDLEIPTIRAKRIYLP